MGRSSDEGRRVVLKTVVVGGSTAFVAGTVVPAGRLVLGPVLAAGHAEAPARSRSDRGGSRLHRWSLAAFFALLGCTHGEPRPAPRVVEETQNPPVDSGGIEGTSVRGMTPSATETSPCAHLSDRLAYLPKAADEVCDAARCRSAGGECAPAGRVCPSACVRRSTDSGKACTAREDCQGQCLAPASAENAQRVAGSCSPLLWNAGCFKSMRAGVVAEICVD